MCPHYCQRNVIQFVPKALELILFPLLQPLPVVHRLDVLEVLEQLHEVDFALALVG